ncbi:hypothetical protein SAMN06265222_103317 [Neorhodopirellula lusitana]|uniref:Uncharacterized protein n=1 Tax=Neorhodopirellula lusitana TaxID=445327 RepID=A0ABY1PX92_9BACT|nr:hypothetical protein SAMN06265222_103317 [Neorhodopirellula lusitana]
MPLELLTQPTAIERQFQTRRISASILIESLRKPSKVDRVIASGRSEKTSYLSDDVLAVKLHGSNGKGGFSANVRKGPATFQRKHLVWLHAPPPDNRLYLADMPILRRRNRLYQVKEHCPLL